MTILDSKPENPPVCKEFSKDHSGILKIPIIRVIWSHSASAWNGFLHEHQFVQVLPLTPNSLLPKQNNTHTETNSRFAEIPPSCFRQRENFYIGSMAFKLCKYALNNPSAKVQPAGKFRAVPSDQFARLKLLRSSTLHRTETEILLLCYWCLHS